MNKINYQKELDKLLDGIVNENIKPKLMLHGCCAPCSSYCLYYLSKYFDITVFFYNPNINTLEEYNKRADELKRFINEMSFENEINIIEADFCPDVFFESVKGYEHCKEGGERCFKCYELRMRETAVMALKYNYDYFCTTLSISPLKDSQKINEIGYMLGKEYAVKWLPSDFKKKNGFKKSVQLSQEHNLYRQNYCGCVFSR